MEVAMLGGWLRGGTTLGLIDTDWADVVKRMARVVPKIVWERGRIERSK